MVSGGIGGHFTIFANRNYGNCFLIIRPVRQPVRINRHTPMAPPNPSLNADAPRRRCAFVRRSRWLASFVQRHQPFAAVRNRSHMDWRSDGSRCGARGLRR